MYTFLWIFSAGLILSVVLENSPLRVYLSGHGAIGQTKSSKYEQKRLSQVDVNNVERFYREDPNTTMKEIFLVHLILITL